MKAFITIIMLSMPFFSYGVSLPLLLQLEQGKGQQKIQIKNTDKTARRYSISVQEISYPNKSKNIINDETNEVWVSERIFTLPAQGQKDIYLAYRGEPTSSERYFNILFQEAILDQQGKGGLAVGKVVSTLLNVLPLNTEIKVDFDGAHLKNRSDATILVMEDLECGKVQGQTILVAPGESIATPEVNVDTILSVGLHDEIKVLVNTCD